MKKAFLIFITVIAVILILWGGYAFFYGQKKDGQPDSGRPVSVRLAWVHQAQFAGMYVAKEKGFYAEEGLNVELREVEQGLDQIREVVSGEVDFTVVGAPELLAGIDKGHPAVAVGVIYQSSPFAYVSRKGLDINAPKDFAGKVLGNAGGSIEITAGYETLLGLHGVDLKSVKFIDLGFDSVGDFLNNRADVIPLYRTDQAYVLDKLGEKYNIMFPEKFGFDVYGDTIITSMSLIDENPDLVLKFVRATMRGWDHALKNIDETVYVVAKYENELYKDSNYEAHILKESIPLIKPVDGRPIGHMEFLKWNRVYRAMIDSGVIAGEFDLKDAYTIRFLK